jgi:hypothetical protein
MRTQADILAILVGIVSAQAQPNELAIRNLQVVPEADGVSAITGTATNQTGRTLSSAFIEFNLYDSRGTVVGNAIDHIENLAPGNSWNFKAETPTRFGTVRVTKVQLFPPAQ